MIYNIFFDRIQNGLPMQNLGKEFRSRFCEDLDRCGIIYNLIDKDSFTPNNYKTIYPLELDHLQPLEIIDRFDKTSLNILRANKNIIILIYWPFEGFGVSKNNYWLEFLQYSLGKLELGSNSKFLVHGNLKIEKEFRKFKFDSEMKNIIFDENLKQIALSSQFEYIKFKGKIDSCYGLEVSQSLHKEYITKELSYKNTTNVITSLDDVFSYKIKEKDFLCYNRLLKPHRLALINEIFRHSLSSAGYISCVESYHDLPKKDYVKYQTQIFLDSDGKKFLEEFTNNFKPIKLAYGGVSLDHNTFCSHEIHIDHFKKSWVSIAVETEYDNDTLAISEKTYKCIVNGHPFIVWGNIGTLEYLKSHGYETFPELFDETYDQVSDHKNRLALIIDQIKSFCTLSFKQKKKKIESIKEKLYHNRRNFLESTKFDNCLKNILMSIDQKTNL